jgi:hypothetical protein
MHKNIVVLSSSLIIGRTIFAQELTRHRLLSSPSTLKA